MLQIQSDRKLLENPVNSLDHVAVDFESIFRSWNGMGNQIRLREESEVCLVPKIHRSPRYHRSNYHDLSPFSKTEAIASGQTELMEMVNQMPESCYELSLRDIVEKPFVLEEMASDHEWEWEWGFNLKSDREILRKKKKESRALMYRSSGRNLEKENTNRGFYLKMGFSKSIGETLKTKKNKDSSSSSLDNNLSSKISPSPLPPLLSGEKEKEQWKKKGFSVLYDSERVDSSVKSSGSSTSSSSSVGDKTRRRGTGGRHRSGGCWSCIYPKCYEQSDNEP